MGTYLPSWLDETNDESIALSVNRFLDSAALNTRQADFVKHASEGVVTNTLILEGFPGSGKTHTLAVWIVILLLQGVKLVIATHSNQGVDELHRKVFALVSSRPDLAHLAKKIVRIYSAEKEETF